MEGEHNAPQTPTPNQNSGSHDPAAAPDDTTIMGALAYIGPLVVVPFLVARGNSFVKYHIKQGLVLFVAEVATWVLTSMMMALGQLFLIVDLGLIVLSIMGVINVVKRQEVEVPLLGRFAKYFTF